MLCPSCRSSLSESTEQCPACDLSLDNICDILKPTPTYTRGLNDPTKLLSKTHESRINNAIHRLEATFPQVNLSVVLGNFLNTAQLSDQLFWIYNVAGFSTEKETAGNNYGILLGISPEHGEAAITLGYGLEIFITEESLNICLAAAKEQLIAQNYTEALIIIIEQLSHAMGKLCKRLGRTLGLSEEFVHEKSAVDFRNSDFTSRALTKVKKRISNPLS